MQPPRSDALSAFERQELLGSLRDVLDDAQVRIQITYTALTSESYNAETGVQTRTETSDANVNAIRRIVDVREAAESGGELEIGDRIYLVDKADLTPSAPKTTDRITDGADVLEVRRWKEDPFEIMLEVTARLI